MDNNFILFISIPMILGLFALAHFGQRDVDIKFLGIVIHLKGK